jgi:hypothetical protein
VGKIREKHGSERTCHDHHIPPPVDETMKELHEKHRMQKARCKNTFGRLRKQIGKKIGEVKGQ